MQLGAVGKKKKRPEADISFKCRFVHLIECDNGNKIHHIFHTGRVKCMSNFLQFVLCVNEKQHILWALFCKEPEKHQEQMNNYKNYTNYKSKGTFTKLILRYKLQYMRFIRKYGD